MESCASWALSSCVCLCGTVGFCFVGSVVTCRAAKLQDITVLGLATEEAC